jgi:hypothetical protein
MLHPVQPSCELALSWAMALQKDLIVGLCDPAMTPRKVTIRWATNLRPPVKDWIERFVNRQYRKKKIIEHMKVIAKLSVSEKQELINHFNEILSFTNAFVDGAVQPVMREIKDCPASPAVLALLEAFYELALRDLHLPVDANGDYGGSFSRDDYVRLHGDLNSPRICPFCDGELNRPQVEHWLGKAKYPALSCHPRNLLPTCYACNAVEKGTTPVINLGTSEPFSEWFHPYERQAFGRLKITVEPPKVKVEAKDLSDDKRVKNLDELLNLSDRWSQEYKHQKQDFLRQLRVRFRREALTQPRFLEEVNILEEAARESVYKAPHAILQSVILERVISYAEELAAWFDDTQAAIDES